MAFREAGCTVDVVCPKGHSVLLTSSVNRSWRYRGFQPLASLSRAIQQSSPAMIVPCDDTAATHLHRLARTTGNSALKELIATSLGEQESHAVSASRAGLHALAERLGVAVPRASVVESEAQLNLAVDAVGLPAFLKTDGSSGGTGVVAVETIGEARKTFRRLSSPPSMVRAAKRVLIDGDHSLLPAALVRKRPQLSLQQAIHGLEANCTIFCWRGEVMARITLQVVTASMQRGPSTVVRRLDHLAIEHATAAIARSLGLSGMYGFDFILEEGTDRAMLIEMNARATQTSHLALGPGHDLAAAAFAALTGVPVSPRPAATHRKLIALFPGELHRDPESRYLELAYHDVPVSEPKLVRLCMSRPNAWKRLLTVQGWQRLSEYIYENVRGGTANRRVSAWKPLAPPRFKAEGAPSQVEQFP